MHANQDLEFKFFPLAIMVLMLIALSIFIRASFYPPAPLGIDAEQSEFSASRAFQTLQHLLQERQPHPADSYANEIVGKRIIEQLTKLGITPEIQDTQVCDHYKNSNRIRCVRVKNIIAEIKGSEPSNAILLSAHYDSVPAAMGASDAGSAVAALIETARLIKHDIQTSNKQPRNSVVFLFNEGEEFGLFGAKAFMREHALAKKVRIALNLEARGTSGKSVMFETGENSGWLAKLYTQKAKSPLTSSLFYEVYKFLPNDTDLTIFKEYNVQGLNFAYAEQLPHYHTPLDNLVNTSLASIQHHGDNVWGVLKVIKDLDLQEQAAENLVFTDILGLFSISWKESFNQWLCVILWLGFAVVFLMALNKKGFSLLGVFKGIITPVILLITSVATAWCVQQLVMFLAGNNQPWFNNAFIMRIAIWASVLAISLLTLRLIAKKEMAFNLLLGWLLTMIILASLASYYLPGISFLFVIPSFVGLALLALSIIFCGRTLPKRLLLFSSIVSLTSGLAFLPIVFLLEAMIGFPLSIALAVMLAFAWAGLLPLLVGRASNQLRIFSQSKAYFSYGVSGIAGTSIIAILFVSYLPSYSAFNPQPINFVYVNTQEKNQLLALTSNLPKPIKNGLTNLSNASLQYDKHLPWSLRKQYAVDFTNEVKPKFITNPKVTINSGDNGLSYAIDIHSTAENLSELIIYIPSALKLDNIQINEQPFKVEQINRNYYQYRCRGLSCKNQKLILQFAGSIDKSSPPIIMAEYIKGLPDQLQSIILSRENIATEIQGGDQSIYITGIIFSSVNMFKHLILIIVFFVGISSSCLYAETIRVAVASNFSQPIKQIGEAFTQKYKHSVKFSFGSSGKLYAQINHGAPFDIFLSADQIKPQKLIENGLAEQDSLFTYAIGQLVLWSADKSLIDNKGLVLPAEQKLKVALANERLAPYGIAAKSVVEKLKLADKKQITWVKGENISQVYQFAVSGNVDLAFVAASQVYFNDQLQQGSVWQIPESLYSPIKQDLVLISRSKNKQVAKQFLKFLHSNKAKNIMRSFGYKVASTAEYSTKANKDD